MRQNINAVGAFVAAAGTEELLDRVTVYRAGMEPAALKLMEAELSRRGVTEQQVAEHGDERRKTGLLWHPDGVAVKCQRCPRPAVSRAWVWHRMFGVLPVFPMQVPLCAAHAGPRAADPGPTPS